MPTYAAQYAAAHPAQPGTTPPPVTFAQRMEMAVSTAAMYIYSETVTAKTPARKILANRIAQPGGAANHAQTFVQFAAVQGFACDDTTTDGQIDGVTGSVWDLVANA